MTCDTGKACYPSAHKAATAMEKTKTTKRRRHKTVMQCHAYRCERCGSWHNTSASKDSASTLRSMHTKVHNEAKRRRQHEAVHSKAD